MAGAPQRVAIVGAGPAGAFAAASLLRGRGGLEIDLLERLPTPWGLLRGGVAPDHQEIKRLEETFERETIGRGCRFLGNVEVGVDVSHSELMRHYTAVVYATGAQTEQVARHPRRGPARQPARDRVRGLVQRPPRLPPAGVRPHGEAGRRDRQRQRGRRTSRACLTLSAAELERTDVADHALEALGRAGSRR